MRMPATDDDVKVKSAGMPRTDASARPGVVTTPAMAAAPDTLAPTYTPVRVLHRHTAGDVTPLQEPAASAEAAGVSSATGVPEPACSV